MLTLFISLGSDTNNALLKLCLGFGNKNLSVRIRKISGFGLKHLVSFPQTWLEKLSSHQQYQLFDAAGNCSRKVSSSRLANMKVNLYTSNVNVIWYVMNDVQIWTYLWFAESVLYWRLGWKNWIVCKYHDYGTSSPVNHSCEPLREVAINNETI